MIVEVVIRFCCEQRLLDLRDDGRSADTIELGLLRNDLQLILPLFDLLDRGPDSAVPILTIKSTQFRFV